MVVVAEKHAEAVVVVAFAVMLTHRRKVMQVVDEDEEVSEAEVEKEARLPRAV